MKTKKELEAENFILWMLCIVFFVIGVAATIGCILHKSEPQEECMDEYWENEYRTIKRLYDLDEAFLQHWKKVDDLTWSVPLEYAPD